MTITQVRPSRTDHVRLINATRKAVRSAQAYSRWSSGAERALPNFVILGAQRCGTTSLYTDLVQHPQVGRPLVKETHFFSLHYDRGERWYRGHFPKCLTGQQTFEATPYYLFHPDVPARASAMLPDTRFVVLLRDPVARAYSHYHHNRALNIEPLTFEQALDAEEARLAEASKLGLSTQAGLRLHRDFSYKSRGMYVPQLERWRSHVPKHRLLVIRSEEFFQEPRAVFAKVLDYLDLPAYTPPLFVKTNVRGSSPTALETAPASTFAELQRHFAADAEQVSRLLG